MKPAWLQACILQQVLYNRKLATGDQVATDVVAVARMSARYPDAVNSPAECVHDKLQTHTSCARNPYDLDVDRIFHPAYSGQVSRSVTTPVTQKSHDSWFELCHEIPFPLN